MLKPTAGRLPGEALGADGGAKTGGGAWREVSDRRETPGGKGAFRHLT